MGRITQEGRNGAHKGKRVLKEKIGQQSNAWQIHYKYRRELISEEDTLL
jgi:hypothetical protein